MLLGQPLAPACRPRPATLASRQCRRLLVLLRRAESYPVRLPACSGLAPPPQASKPVCQRSLPALTPRRSQAVADERRLLSRPSSPLVQRRLAPGKLLPDPTVHRDHVRLAA